MNRFILLGSRFAFLLGSKKPRPKQVLRTNKSFHRWFWRFYVVGPGVGPGVMSQFVVKTRMARRRSCPA